MEGNVTQSWNVRFLAANHRAASGRSWAACRPMRTGAPIDGSRPCGLIRGPPAGQAIFSALDHGVVQPCIRPTCDAITLKIACAFPVNAVEKRGPLKEVHLRRLANRCAIHHQRPFRRQPAGLIALRGALTHQPWTAISFGALSLGRKSPKISAFCRGRRARWLCLRNHLITLSFLPYEDWFLAS
jgi:hypothetical protein